MYNPRHMIVLLAVVGLMSGCNTHKQPTRAPAYSQMDETPDAQYLRRAHYIDNHYQYYIDTGRAKTADQAKALASYQWDREAQQQRLATPSQITNASVRWSSDDARKREQKEFEKKLADMYSK